MSQWKDGREMEAAEGAGEELAERWSARAKTEIVLRLSRSTQPHPWIVVVVLLGGTASAMKFFASIVPRPVTRS